MKQFRITILLTVLMSMFGAKANAHDIAVANKDGVTIYYYWIKEKTELAVSYQGGYSYSYNEYSGVVVIPESVEYEGKSYSVTSIGQEAFKSCSSLTSVTIPNSVTSIGQEAFSFCSDLTSVTIPNSVTAIGSDAFFSTAWYNNQPDGLVYAGKVVYKYKGEMPANTAITLEDGILGIAESAFSGCSGLTSVTIPNSVTSMSNFAFAYCRDLTSVTIPNSVTSIGSSAFESCYSLTSVTIGSSVTSIGNRAFSGCSALKIFKVQVTDLSSFCNNYTVYLLYYNTNKPIMLIDNEGVEIKNFIIPEGVTSIGDYAFFYCSGLTSVTIPNSVTSIGYHAFWGCSALNSIVIGSGITSISDDTFYGTNLKKTIWLTNTPPSGARYAQGAINYVSNEEYNISNKVVYPFLSSYFDVDGVRYVPVSLSDKTCDVIDCIHDESVANTKIGPTVEYKGITMNVLNVQPYIGYNNQFVKSLNVNTKGVLGEYAFYGCSNITNISLGSNLTSIGSNAFAKCSSFEEIKIKPMMTDIKDYAFSNCSSLKKVIIEDSDTELNLGAYIFDSCPLDTVYIGRNINYSTDQYSGYSPFYRNTSLRAVKITDKETEVSENEFYGCTNLQRVIIGDGVTTIGNWAFSGCSSLKFFTFGSEVKTIGQEAFSDCTAVTEITSRAIAPPTCGNQALDDINKWECKLYVPKGHLAEYQAAEQWKEFLFAEEGDYTIATKYTLTYTVDGEVYKTSQVAEGDAITPEPAPTKEGYVFSGWSTIPATMPANDVTITGTFSLPATEDAIKITTAGQTTWCSAYDLDFTGIEGLKAYIASGYDRISGTIWLTRVFQVPANEGILLMGTPGDYKVPHISTGTYYVNMFKGTLQPITIYETEGEYTNYYLSSGTSGVGFYRVSGSVNLKANRAYLPLLKGTTQAGTRFIGLGFEDDGTTNLTPALSKGEGDGEWYTLQGQRVAKPGKGIYIRNGKMVIVR